MKANVSCRPTPHSTTERRMARLCFEKRKLTRRIARIPSIPVKRSMFGSAYHFQDQLALLRRRCRNAERILDLLGRLLYLLFAGIVQTAQHRAAFNFLPHLHFENHTYGGIDGVFLGVSSGPDHGGSLADSLGVD